MTPLVMAKVMFMCGKNPDHEWSGNILYRKKKGEDGVMIFTVEDLALMDAKGSTGYTEFDNKDPYATTYIAKGHRNLLGCYMGLLHSHHNMMLGPSATDDSTTKKEGEAPDTVNFLTIIVYNDHVRRPYSVRVTQKVRHEVKIGNMFANEYGQEVDLGPSNKVAEDPVELEIIDITDIEYCEPAWTEEEEKEFTDRYEELMKKKTTYVSPYYSHYGGTSVANNNGGSFPFYPGRTKSDEYDYLDDYGRDYSQQLGEWYKEHGYDQYGRTTKKSKKDKKNKGKTVPYSNFGSLNRIVPSFSLRLAYAIANLGINGYWAVSCDESSIEESLSTNEENFSYLFGNYNKGNKYVHTMINSILDVFEHTHKINHFAREFGDFYVDAYHKLVECASRYGDKKDYAKLIINEYVKCGVERNLITVKKR